jgi:hypothetical protein
MMRQYKELKKAVVFLMVFFGIIALVSGCVWDKWEPIIANEPEEVVVPYPPVDMIGAEQPEPGPLLNPGWYRLEAPEAKSVFFIWVPHDYAPDLSWPAIFCWYTRAGTGWPFHQVTRGQGFIIVAMNYTPSGYSGLHHGRQWIRAERALFLEALKITSSRLNVDLELVFMGGASKGGYHTGIIGERVLDSLAGLIILAAGRYAIVKKDTASRTRYVTYDHYPLSKKGIRGKRIFIGVGENDTGHNQRARLGARLYESWGADVTFEEWPGVGHIDIAPEFPSKMLLNWLKESVEKTIE